MRESPSCESPLLPSRSGLLVSAASKHFSSKVKSRKSYDSFDCRSRKANSLVCGSSNGHADPILMVCLEVRNKDSGRSGLLCDNAQSPNECRMHSNSTEDPRLCHHTPPPTLSCPKMDVDSSSCVTAHCLRSSHIRLRITKRAGQVAATGGMSTFRR